jgi:hypothetical protein
LTSLALEHNQHYVLPLDFFLIELERHVQVSTLENADQIILDGKARGLQF